MTTHPDKLRRALDVLAKRDKPLQGDLQRLGPEHLTAWVHGALRHRRTLGVVLGAVARRALKGRGPRAVALLELLGYRRLFLDEPLAPVLADVAAAGEGKKVNAHVERVLTAIDAAIAGREPLDPDQAAGDDLLPITRAEAVRFTKPLLGAEARGPAGRLGIRHSLPDPLVAAWIAAHGEETAAELCRAANDPPPLFARANQLQTTRDDLRAALAEEGVGAEVVDDAPWALRLTGGRGRFTHTAPWRAGAFSIQDLTAQRAAPLLAPAPGERLLDLCAAPGGKTTHLAELSRDQAAILACDVKAARLRRIEQNLARLGLSSVTVRRLDGRSAPVELAGERFDGALVDAPCSNTGVLRRRPEARWRYTTRSQQRLAARQGELLRAALACLGPGGRLVYSVCSIEPEEGSEQIAALLAERPALTLTREELWLPAPLGGDGGYAALLTLP